MDRAVVDFAAYDDGAGAAADALQRHLVERAADVPPICARAAGERPLQHLLGLGRRKIRLARMQHDDLVGRVGDGDDVAAVGFERVSGAGERIGVGIGGAGACGRGLAARLRCVLSVALVGVLHVVGGRSHCGLRGEQVGFSRQGGLLLAEENVERH